jgi:hypothetical protein
MSVSCWTKFTTHTIPMKYRVKLIAFIPSFETMVYFLSLYTFPNYKKISMILKL